MPNQNGAQMDLITSTGTSLSGSGSVARVLLSGGFNVNALRTQDVLRKNEWIKFDEKVVAVARKRLVAVGDLMAAGLTYDIPNALGITKVEWETITDLGDAVINMSGISQGQNDRPEFTLNSVPLPIIHKDFQINVRALEASRNMSMPLDTTQAELASRIVSEKIESLLFLGSNVAGSTNKIYGYTTHPNRNTGSVTASWALGTTTGSQILTDLLAMIDKAAQDNMYGPFMLYVPISVYTHLGDDFKANSDKTIIGRLKELPQISDIRQSADLTASNVVLVQMTSDVVDIIDGIQPTMVMWETHGGMLLNFKVLAIMVPRIKADAATQSGIVHYS